MDGCIHLSIFFAQQQREARLPQRQRASAVITLRRSWSFKVNDFDTIRKPIYATFRACDSSSFVTDIWRVNLGLIIIIIIIIMRLPVSE